MSGKGTHEVGKKAANRLGIYDMSGNVYEWCYDWYGPVSTGKETDPTDPALDQGSCRVRRGGLWYGDAYSASVSRRDNGYPYLRYSNLGFRVVRPSSRD